jgi:hypothetical protein
MEVVEFSKKANHSVSLTMKRGKTADYLAAAYQKSVRISISVERGNKEVSHFDLDVVGPFDCRQGKDMLRSPRNQSGLKPNQVGLFYAVQTLRQLLPAEVEKNRLRALSSVRHADQGMNQHLYREMHLDVGRHLFPLLRIKRYIDYDGAA